MRSTLRNAVNAPSVFLSRVRVLAAGAAVMTAAHMATPLWSQSWGTCGSNLCASAGANVGIGTASPAQKLTVSGGDGWVVPTTAGSTSTLYLSNFNNLASQPAHAIRSGDNFFGVFSIHSYRWAGNYDFTSEGPVGSQIPFRLATNTLARWASFTLSKPKANVGDPDDPKVFLSEANSYFVGGNVGIGTAAPKQVLSVAGQGLFHANPQVDDPGDSGGPALRIGYTSNGDYGYILANNTGVTGKNLILQRGGGNVGIGTASPQYKLAVSGTIGAREVIVTNTGWADYVFQPHYQPAPLGEVAKYVKEHHHLPEMPSVEEVRKNGVSLGEMQVKMLAKIEELTLHMIQAEGRNNRLEQQNGQLQERISRLEAQAVSKVE